MDFGTLIVLGFFGVLALIGFLYKLYKSIQEGMESLSTKIESIGTEEAKELARDKIEDKFDTMFDTLIQKSDLSDKISDLKSSVSDVQSEASVIRNVATIVKNLYEKTEAEEETLKKLMKILSDIKDSTGWVQDYLKRQKQRREEKMSNIG